MDAHNLIKLFEQSPVVVPRKLFTDARRLNLNPVEFCLVVHLLELTGEGIEMPLPSELGDRMNVPESEARSVLLGLLQKELVAIDASAEVERYSLLPLFQALEEDGAPEKNTQSLNENLIHTFEREFGTITPFEIEQIVGWLTEDGFSEELILAALREAKLRNVRNFKYMDKILSVWQDHKVESLEDLVEYQRRKK
ncbi:DnaD domain protein [Exiguobacterium sp. SH3S2]|uniref:DnaD domain-containing protein n=1 Tax=Exiguobacterium TaxID=33986 RepID=UPI000877661B|nr:MULTISPECIES: DnaD domain protein [Exiguobacterium]OGX77849.1 DNA replication protein DnaD [Exiguobacterium sp. SH31]TCI27339.1 DnaD domain protein [Exiguobacterium sp. SH5S4]TCI37253.1 DnaD domain protein [Exiguobacterium sp. SH4S7]TCI45384.1 DnaD domain protein [Exiguobacterium sp. SH5S32]TCI49339.1 DnaD domain protein [Exiguobacterium sp. SH3S3]